MRNKIVVFVLMVTMILSIGNFTVLAEKEFTDMDVTHWAYNLVKQLVDEKIIDGYEDGTFRPENTVTRAEFAKLFGQGSKIKPADFVDLPRVHWAYSYIMKSGMDIEQERFYPDRNLTRGEALKALYDRYGSKEKCNAPSIITSQYNNKEAVAWAYSKKLIIGDDGINLRLDDTITRAEAIALILRARNVKDAESVSFSELADDNTLEKYYNCISAFSGIGYSKNSTVTNGEFADVIIKIIGYDIENNNQYHPAYDGRYAKQIAFMTSSVWGKENNNSEFEKSELTVKNAVTGLIFATTMKTHTTLSITGKEGIYPDVTTVSDIEKSLLTYAYENDVFLSVDASLNPDKKITLKEILCYYIQIDSLVGFEESYNGKYKNEPSDVNVNEYPGNYSQFSVILKSVPNLVYINCGLNNAKESTVFVKEYRDIFEDLISQINSNIKGAGVNGKAAYYPTMVQIDKSNVKLVVKLEVYENIKDKKYSDVFNKVCEDCIIEPGTYYLTVSTNSQLVYGFDISTLSVDKII